MDIFDRKGIHPMLISEQVEPYDDEDCIFELKLDGCRCIAYCDKNSVDLRNKKDRKLLPQFPELKEIYKQCHGKCILDGELIVPVQGKPEFYHLQRRLFFSDAFKIELAAKRYPAAFVAYDILYKDGKELMELPLMERKRILSGVVEEIPVVSDLKTGIMEKNMDSEEIAPREKESYMGLSVSRFLEGKGKALFELAKSKELEGVVGKKKESLYRMGKRTNDWQKVKWMKDEDFICIGYIPKEKGMTSLVLAKYDAEGRLNIVTHVTLGVSRMKMRESGIEVGSCPFDRMPKGHENARWLKPVVCTVAYMPSENEEYRQPVFKCFRDDKRSEECTMDEILNVIDR